MIVSLRLPRLSRFSTAPAYGELGSMQALLSLPVMRKFIACGSGSGNVSGVVVGTAVVAGPPATDDVEATLEDVAGAAGVGSAYVARGAATNPSRTRLAASRAPAPAKQA